MRPASTRVVLALLALLVLGVVIPVLLLHAGGGSDGVRTAPERTLTP